MKAKLSRHYSKNKHCECGKLITNKANQCAQCRRKNSPANYIDGRCSKKYYCKCGNKISINTFLRGKKSCHSCAAKNRHKNGGFKYPTGLTAYHFIQGKPKCKLCNKKLNNYDSKLCRKCNDISKKGIMPKGGFPKGHLSNIKPIKYKSTLMRSSWEVAYAKYLDKNKIKWLYESKTFDLGSTTYTPDFYLPDSDTYVEIKGWWRDDAKKKFKMFQKKYCSMNIILLMQKELKKLKVIK